MASQAVLILNWRTHRRGGGKRLRPMSTWPPPKSAVTRATGVPLATVIEFLHTATLLHDDVVDESGLRRGQASANAAWGNKSSVLVDSFVQPGSKSWSRSVPRGFEPAVPNFSRVIAEGEVLQLMASNDTETDELAYLEVIKSKTAQLFAAAAKVKSAASSPTGQGNRRSPGHTA